MTKSMGIDLEHDQLVVGMRGTSRANSPCPM